MDEVFTVDAAAVIRDIVTVGDIMLADGVTFMGEIVFEVKLAVVGDIVEVDGMAFLEDIAVVCSNSVV